MITSISQRQHSPYPKESTLLELKISTSGNTSLQSKHVHRQAERLLLIYKSTKFVTLPRGCTHFDAGTEVVSNDGPSTSVYWLYSVSIIDLCITGDQPFME